MRALLAAGLSLFLAVSAGLPHVHTAAHGADECVVCVARNADVPHDQTPDLAPIAVVVEDPAAAPGLPPVAGAPLGAVPGQSPPARRSIA